MKSHFSILSLSCWAAGVLLRKSLLIPMTSRVFLAPSCTNFRVWGLILRSLIRFKLILVWGDKHGSSFSFSQMDNHFSQQHLVKRLYFLHCIFLAPLTKIRWVYLCGFIPGSSILFHWFSCLFLCLYHAVSIAIALYHSLKSGIVIATWDYECVKTYKMYNSNSEPIFECTYRFISCDKYITVGDVYNEWMHVAGRCTISHFCCTLNSV
jgi:hypothetical protein